MTATIIQRIGFACKWIDTPEQVNGIGPKDDAKKYNTGATTVAWLNRQKPDVADQKLWDLMVQNIEATRLLQIAEANLIKGKPLHTKKIDRALLIMDDLPGIQVSGNLIEGSNDGETDLAITVIDEDLVTGNVSTDLCGI